LQFHCNNLFLAEKRHFYISYTLYSNFTSGTAYESVFNNNYNNQRTVMHNYLGCKADNRPTIREVTAVLMKHVPGLLNAYDSRGCTPLIEAAESSTYSVNEDKVTALTPAIQSLLAQPGKFRVNVSKFGKLCIDIDTHFLSKI